MHPALPGAGAGDTPVSGSLSLCATKGSLGSFSGRRHGPPGLVAERCAVARLGVTPRAARGVPVKDGGRQRCLRVVVCHNIRSGVEPLAPRCILWQKEKRPLQPSLPSQPQLPAEIEVSRRRGLWFGAPWVCRLHRQRGRGPVPGGVVWPHVRFGPSGTSLRGAPRGPSGPQPKQAVG